MLVFSCVMTLSCAIVMVIAGEAALIGRILVVALGLAAIVVSSTIPVLCLLVAITLSVIVVVNVVREMFT